MAAADYATGLVLGGTAMLLAIAALIARLRECKSPCGSSMTFRSPPVSAAELRDPPSYARAAEDSRREFEEIALEIGETRV